MNYTVTESVAVVAADEATFVSEKSSLVAGISGTLWTRSASYTDGASGHIEVFAHAYNDGKIWALVEPGREYTVSFLTGEVTTQIPRHRVTVVRSMAGPQAVVDVPAGAGSTISVDSNYGNIVAVGSDGDFVAFSGNSNGPIGFDIPDTGSYQIYTAVHGDYYSDSDTAPTVSYAGAASPLALNQRGRQ